MKQTLAKTGLLAMVVLGSSIFMMQSASADTTSVTDSSSSMAEMKMKGGDMRMEQDHAVAMKFLGIYGGKVTAVSGNTITIKDRETTYTVEAGSATVMRSGVASTLSSIAIDDMLMIRGDMSGSAITAQKIVAMPMPKKTVGGTMKKMMKEGINDMRKGLKKEMKERKDSVKDSTTNTTVNTSTTN